MIISLLEWPPFSQLLFFPSFNYPVVQQGMIPFSHPFFPAPAVQDGVVSFILHLFASPLPPPVISMVFEQWSAVQTHLAIAEDGAIVACQDIGHGFGGALCVEGLLIAAFKDSIKLHARVLISLGF
jgi:hypothetical protein